ncbi:MAG: hypothetical protein JZD41_03390 [Thermoproteus sp.]|nr:hypothetical protein [Thermoproteus sp.]
MDFHCDVSSALLKKARELDSLLAGVAEHHPYWAPSYYMTQALALLFERWNGGLSGDELEQLTWYIEKAGEAVRRLKEAG